MIFAGKQIFCLQSTEMHYIFFFFDIFIFHKQNRQSQVKVLESDVKASLSVTMPKWHPGLETPCLVNLYNICHL